MWPYTENETQGIAVRIAQELGLGSSSDARFLAKGSNNEVFYVEGGAHRVVIRVTGDWRERQTYRERWCYRRAAELGIPGPRVLAVGKVEKLPYIAMEFLPGRPGDQLTSGLDRVWRTLGEYAFLINSVDIDSGEIREEGRLLYEDPRLDWPNQIESCLDRTFLEEVEQEQIITSPERTKIIEVLNGAKNTSMRFGLSHGDLDPRNVIVSVSGTVSLIDWCCSVIGPVPHVDLYNILRETPLDGEEMSAYLEGYGMSRAQFQRLLPEIRLYDLVAQLLDLRWAKRDRPDLQESRAAGLRRCINNFFPVT